MCSQQQFQFKHKCFSFMLFLTRKLFSFFGFKFPRTRHFVVEMVERIKWLKAMREFIFHSSDLLRFATQADIFFFFSKNNIYTEKYIQFTSIVNGFFFFGLLFHDIFFAITSNFIFIFLCKN